MEPEKPFACGIMDCGMSFTNEDHLHVHKKKHDMVLQLGTEQKTTFVADQTPTPTRFIRNCEEVGLFQDLQNVNPFDEGFKKAMETRSGILSLENTISTNSDDVLHTPQMVFPNLTEVDSTMYSTTNNQKNITISRSSSDESGVIKEYETTTISQCTNEVTISRVVGKPDVIDKVNRTDDLAVLRLEELGQNKDAVNQTVSYTNNVIKIHSNVEIMHAEDKTGPLNLISYADSVVKDASNIVTKDVILSDASELRTQEDINKSRPIISQKSLDFVVDSLSSDEIAVNSVKENVKNIRLIKTLKKNFENNFHKKQQIVDDCNKGINNTKMPDKKQVTKINVNRKRCAPATLKKVDETDKMDDFEAVIKLPSGKCVRMKAVEETEKPSVKTETKEILKKILKGKELEKDTESTPLLQNVCALGSKLNQYVLPSGTLIPVTILNTINNPIVVQKSVISSKVPIPVAINAMPKPGRGKYPRELITIEVPAINDNNKKTIVPKKNNSKVKQDKNANVNFCAESECIVIDDEGDGNSASETGNGTSKENGNNNGPEYDRDGRNAASKRYRERQKERGRAQAKEIALLKEKNKWLAHENALLKLHITKHMEKCSSEEDDFRELQDKLKRLENVQVSMNDDNL